ncbi:hypothetical protein L1987_47607 [Smallanthus sonchifolius]|uniref:Uncharacterized protein n=1 Tax=Smallanthus sonchifolius TaxID=185202 RepID=A0ACB9G2E0_9ASTR|nr:hypothetical protein L1987_47607 [Smallanthus sonchifolius]
MAQTKHTLNSFCSNVYTKLFLVNLKKFSRNKVLRKDISESKASTIKFLLIKIKTERAFDCKLPLQFPPVSYISPSLSQSKTPLQTGVLQLQKSHTDALLAVKLRAAKSSKI